VARETLASWAIVQTAAERRELTRAVAESVVRTLGEERGGEAGALGLASGPRRSWLDSPGHLTGKWNPYWTPA
jgi:hypothetical protein